MAIHFLNKYAPWCLGLIFFCLPLSSHGASISMQYELGFDGRFELHKWAPLTVVLTNRGATTRGTLEVIVTSGSEYFGNVRKTVHVMDVEIAHNSKKLCAFTIHFQSVAHALVIRYKTAQQVLVSEAVNLRARYSNRSLIAVLDAGTTPDFLSALSEDFLAVPVRARNLPETWYGYEGVRMLVVNPDRLEGLRDRQYRALEQWLRLGGLVMTFGGANYGALLQERPQRLLPMQVQGHRRFFEIEAFEAFCGRKLAAQNPFLVLHARVDDAQTMVVQNGIPIVVQKKIALGRMVFLAVDPRRPPFSHWDRQSQFWDRILSLAPAAIDPMTDPDKSQLMASIAANPPRLAFPDVKMSMLFVAVYSLMLGWIVKRLTRQSHERWKNVRWLLATIALGSLLSYGLSYRSPADRRLVYNGFLQLNVDGGRAAAAGDYTAGLYSLGGAIYDLSFGDTAFPISFLVPPPGDTFVPNDHLLVETGSGQIIRGGLTSWSRSFLNFKPRLRFALTGAAVWRSDALEISIDNASVHRILDGLIYYDGRYFSMGDLAAGEERILRITRRAFFDPEAFGPQDMAGWLKRLVPASPGSLLARVQSKMATDWLSAVHAGSQTDRDHLQLIGWVRSGIIQPVFKPGGVKGEAAALIRCRIPLGADDDEV